MPESKGNPAKRKSREEEEEEEESEEDEEEIDIENTGRGKRKKKKTLENLYEPEDFTMNESSVSVILNKGRGKKLKDLPLVKASIEKQGFNTDILDTAHRLLFGQKGKFARKEKRNHLLEFNGYLKVAPKGLDEKKLEEFDEPEETKIAIKAFKLDKAKIVLLLDFFKVDTTRDDGTALHTKDSLVDRLLDFLGEPSEDWVVDPSTAGKRKKKPASKKGTKKASAPKKPTTKKAAAPAMPKDSFALVRKHKKGSEPSDEALRQWVKAYVVCFDMDKATTKHALTTASEKFGVDLKPSKERIKVLLAEEM